MSLLKAATVEQAAAKIGILGRQGSGKTTTAALILIGLSKTYHQSAPVAFQDTENGSDYLVPIFEAEGVPLLVVKSRSFADMKDALIEAEQAKCCGHLVDSYSHPWKELCDSFKAKSRRRKLEFHHMDELKSLWQTWTDLMLNSPLHCVLAGRLGYEWDREDDDEDGTKGDLVKLGTKMKGESEAGYEPSLLIELEGVQDAAGRDKTTRAKKSTIVHRAYVLKDRWRVLNGRAFTFKDLNSYKAGDYKKVFDAFRPHFDRLAIGKAEQRAVNGHRSSADLFAGAGDDGWKRKKDIALEEIRESIAAVFPGQDAASKRARQVVLETLFDTLSWSKVESLRLDALEVAVPVLVEFRKHREDRDRLSDEDGIVSVLNLCRDLANATMTLEGDHDDEMPLPAAQQPEPVL